MKKLLELVRAWFRNPCSYCGQRLGTNDRCAQCIEQAREDLENTAV